MLQVTNLFQIFCDWLQLFLTKKEEAQLFTRCSLLVEIHSLLVTRCKITRYLLQNSLVTRCRSCSLQKVTRLVTRCKIRSLLVAEVARCKKSLVTRCRSCSLQKITRYSLQKLLVAKNHSLLVAKFTRCSLQRWGHFMKKKLHHRCFPVNFCETLRTLIL